jgi:LysR family transcriptional regulator, benzoate and cis,cis-muconate-responsive activator of ben and cat genes
LRAFTAVAEAHSVRKAAQRLRVAQSALSRTIRDLEHDLGVVLFVRSPHGVRLSESGERFMHGARRTLLEANAAIARARDARASEAGPLVVAMVNPELRPAWIQAVLRRYRKAMPGVMVHLEFMPSIAMAEAATLRAIDVGIGHVVAASPGVTVTTVADDALGGVIVAPTHRLARRRGVSILDLEPDPFLWYERATHPVLFDRIFSAFRQIGFTPKHVPAIGQVGNVGRAVALVSGGFGWALYPSMARPSVPSTVRYLKLTDLSIPLQIDVVKRADDRSARTRAFVRIVEQLVPEGGGR